MITRIMTQNKELKEFIDEMIKIFEEKRPKYQDTWKTIPFSTLKAKMDKQIENLSQITTKRKYMQSLTHVAIYGGLLWNRMND